MRGKVAKGIRKEARKIAANNPTKYFITKAGVIFCTGFRRIYQNIKRDYKNGHN